MKKRIMVTGGCGFIGSHMIEHILVNTDWDIVVVDKLTYASSGLDRLRDLSCFNVGRVLPIHCDITQPFSYGVEKEIGKLDYIVYMGAETHVERSIEDAVPFAMANMLGTTVLLEWVKRKQKGLNRFIQFGTDEVYGSAPDGVYYKEWDTMRPSNPYSASKAGADMMAFAFSHSFNIPILITRTMNCIGERQDIEKFVPKTIRSILLGEKIVVHGKDAVTISKRCWLHARNAADAILYLINSGVSGEMFHVVGEEYSVLDVANMINQEINGRDLSKEEVTFVDFHSARPGHDIRYGMTGEKLAKFGWSPKVDFKHSLKKAVRWTMEHKDWLGI